MPPHMRYMLSEKKRWKAHSPLAIAQAQAQRAPASLIGHQLLRCGQRDNAVMQAQRTPARHHRWEPCLYETGKLRSTSPHKLASAGLQSLITIKFRMVAHAASQHGYDHQALCCIEGASGHIKCPADQPMHLN